MKIPHPSRRLAIAGGALAAVALAGGAVALATTSSSSAVYKGCLSRVGGLLYNARSTRERTRSASRATR